MTISITATDIEPSRNSPIPHVGTQFRMECGNYIYFTPDVARQWISVLDAIADQAPKRYVIVDKMSGAIDWDCELHPTRHAAIDSMCNIRQMYVSTPDQANEDKVYWADHYEICEVRTINEEKSE